MRAVNPRYIPRNHRIAALIDAAVERDDFAPFEELLKVLEKPYEDQPDFARYALPPEPQERVLQGLAGVEEITGNANSGGTDIILTFAIGTDMKAALVDVIGRMSRLPPLPRDADRPVVQLGGFGDSKAIFNGTLPGGPAFA